MGYQRVRIKIGNYTIQLVVTSLLRTSVMHSLMYVKTGMTAFHNFGLSSR